MAKLVWEKIDDMGTRYSTKTTYRAKVPGGWLVQTDIHNEAGGLTFVRDPNHSWK